MEDDTPTNQVPDLPERNRPPARHARAGGQSDPNEKPQKNSEVTEDGNKQVIPPKKEAASLSANLRATSGQVARAAAQAGGALGNALMRTFRGDISAKAGGNAEKLAERYLPNKGKPVTPPGAVTRTRETDEKKKKETIVRTYKQDVQQMVRTKGVSMTRMAALESDRTTGRPKDEEGGSWKTTSIFLVGALFVTIGIVTIFGMYFVYKSRQVEPPLIDVAPSIIFAEARERIDITARRPRNIVQQFALARRNLLFSLGSVVEFYPTKLVETPDGKRVPVPVGASEFLKSIGAQVDDAFLTTLGQKYMLGVHVIDENVPFMVLTSNSYGHTFSGFFAWERTIESDLAPFFSPTLEQTMPAIIEGDNKFVDTVIQNLDVRILRDENRDIRLLYSFIDRSTVVVTTNIRTLIELSNRLQVQR